MMARAEGAQILGQQYDIKPFSARHSSRMYAGAGAATGPPQLPPGYIYVGEDLPPATTSAAAAHASVAGFTAHRVDMNEVPRPGDADGAWEGDRV
jgi:hypothetical protein